MPRADGVVVDSVHYPMDRAAAGYGGASPRGVAIGFKGTVTSGEWVRGRPVRETQSPGTTVFAGQLPDILEPRLAHAGGPAVERRDGMLSWS